tara:strand:- start:2630 stop:3007 length:378 start_codon:yes stop_codon:yes gene_type:complete
MNDETAKKLISNIKFGQTRNAARKSLGQGLRVQPIEVSSKDLIRKFHDQEGKCYWSGISLDENFNYIKRHPLAISVDRLDNQIGYVYDNLALTLRIFNLGKGSFSGDFAGVMKTIKESWHDKTQI